MEVLLFFHLPWLPRGYSKILREIMKVEGVTRADLKRRVANLERLDLTMRRRLRAEKMLPQDVYRYCMERIWT
jgi:hypothetical protein